jgi:hypothetical protein
MACSHGQRSSSSSGMPWRILLTFAAGWNWSPSAICQPCLRASASPIVVLPVPLTPMTTTVSVRWGRSIAHTSELAERGSLAT